MGILNKLMFWKKDDEFDFDKAADKEFGGDILQDDLGLDRKPPGLEEKSPFDEPTTEQPSGNLPSHLQQPRSSFQTAQQQISGQSMNNKDLELISSKLDTLKAILTSMDQRISNLERSAGVERKQKLW